MKHFYHKIPGWFDFQKIYDYAILRMPKYTRSSFVEVGSWYGKSTAYLGVEILNSCKPIDLFCVDAWDTALDTGLTGMDASKAKDYFYSGVGEPLLKAGLKLNVLNKSSIDASGAFSRQSVNFIFIDAAHDFESVVLDLEAWIPTLAPGGIIAGHDITKKSVRDALEAAGNYYPWMNNYQGVGNSWMVDTGIKI